MYVEIRKVLEHYEIYVNGKFYSSEDHKYEAERTKDNIENGKEICYGY